MTAEQLELAGRDLCRQRGVDPDAQAKFVRGWREWEVAAHEVRTFEQVLAAFRVGKVLLQPGEIAARDA